MVEKLKTGPTALSRNAGADSMQQNNAVRADNTVPDAPPVKKIPGALLYDELKKSEKKSAGELKVVIERWLKDASKDGQELVADSQLIDPILINFVNNNYSRTSNKEVLPMPGEKLVPIKPTEKKFFPDKAPLYSLEDQKKFLENELALAAALDGLSDEEVINFVNDHMDPKDRVLSENESTKTIDTNALVEFASEAIKQGNPVMLNNVLKELDGWIAKIEKSIVATNTLIHSQRTPGEAEMAAEPDDDQPASQAAPKDRWETKLIGLRAQHDALVKMRKEVVDFLKIHPESDSTTNPALNPGH